MNDIITNGAEIKQRIINEIQQASQNIFLAMAFFTDRDIANAIIEAQKKGVNVDIVLSSNAQNETVRLMFKGANVSVHAFETGDDRGMMHHKFCLIDNRISINGSYNYSYNASNNNVENIQVSDDLNTYKQLLSEFERIKYNIDHQIDVNINTANPMEQIITKAQTIQPIKAEDSFSQQLSNLIYATANFNTDSYRQQGYDNAKDSKGSIEIFSAKFGEIKEKIKIFASDDSLSSKKNVIIQNIDAAFEAKKAEIDEDRKFELSSVKSKNEIDIRQLNSKISEIKQAKLILESGNSITGEKGLLQLNKEVERNRLDKNLLESNFLVRKFGSVGTKFAIIGLFIFVFYLSIFFASAMYKVFFEGNVIRNSLQAGINPGMPQLVDANAIVKIFRAQGFLFGIMASLFFLIPILLSNLKLIGSKNKWFNLCCFIVGLVVFDVLVSSMVAINTDEIKSLLVGRESNLKIWEVLFKGEFWLIFVFGMLPLLITHFILDFLVNAYQKSQPEIVNAEKNKEIQMLDRVLLDLNLQRDIILNNINEKEIELKSKNEELERLELELNNQTTKIEGGFLEVQKNLKVIYESFKAKVISGRIFTDEILNSVATSYRSGFIEYLPEFYAPVEVSNRVKEIDQVISNHA